MHHDGAKVQAGALGIFSYAVIMSSSNTNSSVFSSFISHFSRLALGHRLFVAALRHNKIHPLTVRALSTAFVRLYRTSHLREFKSGLMITEEQVDQFLVSGWDYTEERLNLLQATGFAIAPAGVDRLTQLYSRMARLSDKTFEEALVNIYQDPDYPIFQHVGQAFRNQVAGRQSFVLHSVAELDRPAFQFCDVGCGAGILLGDVLEAFPQSFAFGVDISRIMLQHAQKVLKQWSLDDQVKLLNADLRRLPFSPSQFDVVVALEVLEHLPEPQNGLRELLRVLKPEGLLLTSIPVQSNTPGHLYLFRTPQDVIEFHRTAGLEIVHLQVDKTAPDMPDVKIASRPLFSHAPLHA
jgi:2-polyprenyl-3-methyl-5-hydroxy-6-metoxy-1,4-benzoquinol methylase